MLISACLTGGPQGAESGCKFCSLVVLSKLNKPEIPAQQKWSIYWERGMITKPANASGWMTRIRELKIFEHVIQFCKPWAMLVPINYQGKKKIIKVMFDSWKTWERMRIKENRKEDIKKENVKNKK